jgi:hypothetical protein
MDPRLRHRARHRARWADGRSLVHRTGSTEGRPRHRARGCDGVGGYDFDPAADSGSRTGRRPAMLAELRGRSKTLARSSRGNSRPSGQEVPLDARARELHRVPSRVLRGAALRQLLRRHDLRARRRDREDPLAPPGGGDAPVQPRDRRSARDRQLPGGDRHGARPQDWSQHLAGKDRRKSQSSPVVVEGTGSLLRIT